MKAFTELRLRTSVVLLQVSTIVITLAVTGTALMAYVIAEFSQDNLRYAARASETMAARVETFLDDLTSHVRLVGDLYASRPLMSPKPLLGAARDSDFSAIFLVGADARLKSASLSDGNAARESELEGVDLSAYPLLISALAAAKPTWSDKHISAITGNVTVGLAVPLDGGEAIVAEVPLGAIVEVGNVFREKGYLDYWIVDSKGEVVADTAGPETRLMNLSDLDIVRTGFSGDAQPDLMTFRGQEYHVSATYSDKLGWLFVGRVPAGLANPELRKMVFIVLAFASSIAFFGFLLAPLWAQRIARPVTAATRLASQIAAGRRPDKWPHGVIREFNELSDDLKAMSDAIARREEELRELNEGLEARVADRTKELTRINADLKTALAEVRQARDELVQSEKVAALGRMVAGISHELNTPLGNGRMAVSTLGARLERFRDRLSDPADRKDLEKFLETVGMSVEIAESNLARAADLIRSFKEISADRTASRRRKVALKELLDEVALTLTPLLKRGPTSLEIDVAASIWVDSYPGEIGQVVTNLVENAVLHAFQGRQSGRVAITAEPTGDDSVTILLSDDGDGMPPDVAGRAFDPFFTTALGQGGTGLGLFIVHRTVENVLGGTVTLKTAPGEGCVYTIRIPQVAPDSGDVDGQESLRVG